MFSPTFIAPKTHFTGILTCLSECVIQGTFEGKITSQEAIIIKPMGSFKGTIHAPILVVEGRCEGTIYCDKVKILPQGLIHGEICSHQLIMHPKAGFEGRRIVVDKIYQEEKSGIEFDTENILL